MKKTGLILCLFMALAMTTTSWAAICPTATPIGAISGLVDPYWVASDSNGNLYVTEGVNQRLKILDYKGRLLKTIKVYRPLGVAVDDSGIYVASRGGAVSVFNKTSYQLERTIYTASGWPAGLALSAGNLFVTYPTSSTIYVYNKLTGEYLYYFKSGDGEFYYTPLQIAVDETNGILYVSSESYPGVYMFNSSGGFISKFISDFDSNGGVLVFPRGIDYDSAGRIYVADVGMLNINVFDNIGTTLCQVPASETYRRPFGLSIGPNNVLYMVDKDAGKIFMIGLDNYIMMRLSTNNMSFQGSSCGVSPQPQAFTIYNDGAGALNWTVSSNASWITTSMPGGEILGGSGQDVRVQVDTTGLAAGTYTGTLLITAPGMSERVSVSLEITAPPSLSVTGQSSISFFVKGKDVPPAENLTLELSGDTTGLAEWTATADASWIGVTPPKGASNTLSIIDVGLNLTDLKGGEYDGTVTISAVCSTGGPFTIPVHLSYIKGGNISVTTNIDEAKFTITGPATFTGIGKSFTAEAVPEGIYTITFDKIKGFKAPESISQSVLDGQTTTFTGNYTDLRKRMRIVATLAKSPESVTNELRIFDASGNKLTAFPIDIGKNDANKKFSATTAVGDYDGDGIADILTSRGKGGTVTGFRTDGTTIAGLNFIAFKDNEADVTSGDLDGDGQKEIIVSSRTNAGNTAEIRVFSFNGGNVIDTGINFVAYNDKGGVNVSVADIDNDAIDEIITIAGKGDAKNNFLIRILKADTKNGAGYWTVQDNGDFYAGASVTSPDIATGDLDGDSVPETVTVTVPNKDSKTAIITVYKADGSPYGVSFDIEAKDGVTIAAGDTDFDGVAEIVIADNAGGSVLSRVRVYTASGSLLSEFNAFDIKGASGVNISMGEMGF